MKIELGYTAPDNVCIWAGAAQWRKFLMSYINTVYTVTSVLFAILTLCCIHFIFFAIVGLFRKKTYPETDTKLRYGIIIPARNEEFVVGNLIDSVKRNKYPQDKLEIFVIAHNCTDKTAEIARAHGAVVYEYNNPEECTMGYAFRYLFKMIKRDYGIESFDGFFLFNADNVLDVNYFSKMNDAFVARGRKTVITSFRNSKNFGENLISACYGLYFVYGCRFESRGRTALGCSTRVQGTGYVIPASVVKDGWKYVTLTEDWEFTADRILLGEKIEFCDDAVFYDEQPTSLRVMWRQRVRWSKGHLLVCFSRFTDMFRELFSPKKDGVPVNKGSVYDIMINITPMCVITTSLILLEIIAVLFSPFFGVKIGTAIKTIIVKNLGFFAIAYVMMIIASCIIYAIERDRIKHVSFPIKLLSVLLWPLFLVISVPAELVALFQKNVTWQVIPHTNTTSFSDLNCCCAEHETHETEEEKVENEFAMDAASEE